MFANVVRANRQRLGLTQEELGTNAGLSVRTIRKIEAGQVGTPRPATVRLLADAFGLVSTDREDFCQSAAGRHSCPPARSSVPAQLPADVSAFTGRAKHLAYLDALLAGADDQPNAVVISALSGTAGVGKTALAVHWAHQVVDRFPDGQLYVNLRGHHPEQPTDPAEALTRLLSSLGVTGQNVPQELDDRAALYRSEIANRRMLIVLDNAGSVEQVRALLPGNSSSAVVVTSRDRLAGLVAVHGAHRLDLDLLPPAEAITLLRRLIGPRVDAEPEAAATLADQCARLPLALRVAAELAASWPTAPLAELVAELGDQQRRLDLLDCGDPYAAVRTVLSWSIQRLPSDAAGTFRLLGLHPGPDIHPYAVAALAGTSVKVAHRRLDQLTRAHLLEPTGPGRYGMHDLLRAYAAELTQTYDTEQVRHAALSRLLDHYRHTASVAMDTAYPYERDRRPRIPPAGTPTPDLSNADQAIGWLDIEHPNLMAAARYAADHGWPKHTLDLSAMLQRQLRTRGRYHDAEALHRRALELSRTAGDRGGEQDALLGLGDTHRQLGQNQQALDCHQEALEIARSTGNRTGELNALRGLGHVHLRLGRYQPALDYHQQVLEIARSTGDRTGELNALVGLGHIHLRLGHHQHSLSSYRKARLLARATGNRTGELNALRGLGNVERRLDRHQQALNHLKQALEIARGTGYRDGEVGALLGLGHIHRLQGRRERAADHYQVVLDIARETGDRNWRFEALQGLGRVRNAAGDADTAFAHHLEALDLAINLQQPADQARAHDGIACAHRALNQPEPAREHWLRALSILASLGTDHTEDEETNVSAIRVRLAALDES